MAENPRRNRRSGNKAEATETENTVSDATETTEAPTPAPEAKVDKPKVDHEQNLFDAIVIFAGDTSDEASLQEAYRAVPAAARGKAQGVAMKRAMAEGGVDMEVLGSVLDAFNNLPTATKASRTKVELDPTLAGAIRLKGLMDAFNALRVELGEDSYNLADTWLQSEVPEDNAAAVTKVAESVTKASALRGGNGGPRTTFKESLKDLLERGAINAGAELTGANDAKAVVNAEGTVTVNGEVYTSLSTAASALRPKADGSGNTSTNGWDFWQYDGKPVGALRAN